MANKELELVREKQVKLNDAIVASGVVKLLAREMNSAGLMSDDHHDDITEVKTWWTDRDRAGSIVKILRDKVRLKPTNLEKFMNILRSNSQFRDILDVLETTADN